MRNFVIALGALFFVVAPALAYYPGQIEKRVTFYEDDNYRTQVGEATFHCDGTIDMIGLVTSSAVEDYYGCD